MVSNHPAGARHCRGHQRALSAPCVNRAPAAGGSRLGPGLLDVDVSVARPRVALGANDHLPYGELAQAERSGSATRWKGRSERRSGRATILRRSA